MPSVQRRDGERELEILNTFPCEVDRKGFCAPDLERTRALIIEMLAGKKLEVIIGEQWQYTPGVSLSNESTPRRPGQ